MDKSLDKKTFYNNTKVFITNGSKQKQASLFSKGCFLRLPFGNKIFQNIL